MKVGDSIMIYSTAVCYAPVESIGMQGVIVEDLSGGLYPAGRYMVRFTEPVCGYTSWIYDERELLRDDSPLLWEDTAGRAKLMRDMYNSGKSKAEIARHFGVSYKTVFAHLSYS